MQRLLWGLALVLSAACLTVPPEQPPPDNPRKATATVDNNGRVITGGNLTIDIPAGAIAEGERVQVTIDEIRGAPDRHVNDAYLVGPEGYTFLKDVKLTYDYSERMVRDVSDPGALFLGVAQGQSWRLLDSSGSDLDARKVWGQVGHFSVFGLIDPNAEGESDIILDAGSLDRAGQDRDAGQPDREGQDASLPDHSVQDGAGGPDASATTGLLVQLTWDTANADLDLHLYQASSEPFNNRGDCYYFNCKFSTPLDWPPSGAANNPVMDLDDTNGYGPENISMAQPESGSYVAAVHLYNTNGDTLPISYTLRVFQGQTQKIELTREVTSCDELARVANIDITSGQVTVSERSDAPTGPTGRGQCP